MKIVFGGLIASLALVLGLGSNFAGDKDKKEDKKKPKFTIKEVMNKAHVPGAKSLMRKVAAGKAGSEEKKLLVELYTVLSQNKPPKGDMAAWKKRTAEMVKTAKAAAKGDEKAADSLTIVVDCMACHDQHRIPKDDD